MDGLRAHDDVLHRRIQGFDIFKNCTDDFIAIFTTVAKLQTLPAGTVILSEGQFNDRLLILSSGQVAVIVNGERVALLNNPGDLMGEMSVLTGRVASASLITLTEVEYLQINAHELEPSITRSEDGFGYRLYSLLASVLSDKLVRTNEKARQFEIANRALEDAMNSLREINRTLDHKVQERTLDLQAQTIELERSYKAVEAQNTELIASHRKLEELYSTKDMTFKKLNELQKFLVPLKEALAGIHQVESREKQLDLEKAKGQLDTSIEMLLPMSELYSTEQAIRSRKVLLLEPDRKQQVVSRLALGGTGVNLDIASNEEEAQAHLRSNKKYDLVFVSSELASLIPELRARLSGAKFVLMASTNVTTEIPIIKANAKLISNIVSRHPEDRTFTVKNVSTTVSKLIAKDIFGLEKYLIWGVEIQSREITGSEPRRILTGDMQSRLRDLGVRSSITDRAAVVAEELLMNAIYDAPVDAHGRALYNHLPRSTAVSLPKGEQSTFRFGCDGMLAGISVTDPFGGFGLNVLIDYLERNYASNGQSVQLNGKGGAGRGLHLIIESSDLVVFNVQRNVRTEVIALFNLDTRAKVEGANPSFHFFMS